MVAQFNPSQIIDTGFILFTVFTCGYALLGNKDRSEERSRRWIAELSALQEALRELIGEAGAASSNLDRTLQKRKLELEKLLQKLDAAETPKVRPAADELPNETWAM